MGKVTDNKTGFLPWANSRVFWLTFDEKDDRHFAFFALVTQTILRMRMNDR